VQITFSLIFFAISRYSR